MKKILYRADAANIAEIGTGHISRAFLLSKYLHPQVNFEILAKYEYEYQYIEKFNNLHIKIHKLKNCRNNSIDEANAINAIYADLIIVDRLKTTKYFINKIKKYKKVIVLDDCGNGGQYADAQINALLFKGEKKHNEYRGLDYLLLNQFECKFQNKKNNDISFFISFGGYDHRNLTHKIATIFDEIFSETSLKSRVIFVVNQNINLPQWASVVERPNNFFELMCVSDWIICSGGLTAFEAAGMGKNIIAIPQYGHQLTNLINLSKKINLQFFNNKSMRVNTSQLKIFIEQIIKNKLQGNKLKLDVKASNDKFIEIIRRVLNE
jgi:spore coat polysaccharide biosynthesis predicted glycosyltransferase SpsG